MVVRAVVTGVEPERTAQVTLFVLSTASEALTRRPVVLKEVLLSWDIARPLPKAHNLVVMFEPFTRSRVVKAAIRVENGSCISSLTVKRVSTNDARVTCDAVNVIVPGCESVHLPVRVEVTDCSDWECELTVHTDSLETAALPVPVKVNCRQAVLRCPLVVAAGVMGMIKPGAPTWHVSLEIRAGSLHDCADTELILNIPQPVFKSCSESAEGKHRLSVAVVEFARHREEAALRLVVGEKPISVLYRLQVRVMLRWLLHHVACLWEHALVCALYSAEWL
jgi:hypothetical protein